MQILRGKKQNMLHRCIVSFHPGSGVELSLLQCFFSAFFSEEASLTEHRPCTIRRDSRPLSSQASQTTRCLNTRYGHRAASIFEDLLHATISCGTSEVEPDSKDPGPGLKGPRVGGRRMGFSTKTGGLIGGGLPSDHHKTMVFHVVFAWSFYYRAMFPGGALIVNSRCFHVNDQESSSKQSWH